MPTMDEYARSGGYARDAQAASNLSSGNYVGGSNYSGSSGYMNIPKATAPAAPVAPAMDYNKMLAQALAKQQADAETARKAAEAAAAAKKQQYVDTQTGLYNNYFNDQQNSQLAALRNARETALQGYNGTERVAQQTAYNNSNQVDAQHTQSAQRLKEIMAANGLLSSGDNVTQNLQLENQRQNALYDINQSKGNLLQDIAEKRSLVNNQAASQEQGLAQQISADKTKALIDLQQYGDQKETDLTKFNYGTYVDGINRAMQQQQNEVQTKLAEANLTGQYNGSQTLAALNSARQDALQRAGLTGSLDGQATLAGRGQAFDQSMGIADRTGQMPDGMKTLAAQQLDRQNKNDNISLAQWLTQTYGMNAAPKSDAGVAFDQVNGQQTLAAQQMGLQNRQANLDAALKMGQQDGRSYDPKQDWGLIRNQNAPLNLDGQKLNQDNAQFQAKLQQSAQQFASQMGLDYSKLSLQQQNMLMDNAAQMANIGLQRDKFNYDKDPNNIDNQYKQAEIKYKESQSNKLGGNDHGIDEYDLVQVDNLAKQAGIDVNKAKTEDIRSFVADLKGKHGWDANEAKSVENYLTGKADQYNQQNSAQKAQKAADDAASKQNWNDAQSTVYGGNPYLFPWQR